MQNTLLVILSLLLAMVGGTGLFMLSPLLMNSVYLACVIAIAWIWYQRYQIVGFTSIELNAGKSFVLLLYVFFLMANVLKETILYTDYQFNAVDGILRDYTDYFRGLVGFIITAIIYSFVKNSKFLIILPPLCLSIILIGQFLEVNQIIDLKSNINKEALDNSWQPTPDDILVSRPGGFTNANMTAALALIWLFMAIESKLSSSVLIKGLTFILALTVCLLTQSRAALLFLTIYIIYKLIILRNFKFLFFIFIFSIIGTVLLFYFKIEAAQDIADNFVARADSKEGSAVERLQLINFAIDSFLNSPAFGNGIFYLQKLNNLGISSHNQILEILTNYGITGLVMMIALYFYFYHLNSFLYLSLCIFPTLFFSHNFFETNEYQVALAFAYTLSKSNINIEKSS